MIRTRLAALALAASVALSGCSLLLNKVIDISDDPGPAPTSTAPVVPDGVQAMNAAHAAFTKALGDNAQVAGIKYGTKKSLMWSTDANADTYVFQDGTLSRSKDLLLGRTTNKGFALAIYTPDRMLQSLGKQGVCTQVDDMSMNVYYSGDMLITASCNDAKGARTVQVDSGGTEFKTVDPRTKDGMTTLWADMMRYGPVTFQIQSYEWWFVADGKGKQPGVYTQANALKQWRYASPQHGQIFSEVLVGENLAGKPWIPYARYNANSFWTAYEATQNKCGSVDKLAVAYEGTAAPFTTVIVGTGGTCTLTVESTRSKG